MLFSLQFSPKGIDSLSLRTSAVTFNSWLNWKREESQSKWPNDYKCHSQIPLREDNCIDNLINIFEFCPHSLFLCFALFVE